MAHPVFKNRYHTFFYFSIWMFIMGIHFLLIYQIYNIPFYAAIIESFVFNFILSCLGLSTLYVVKYNRIEQSKIFKVLSNHLAAALLITFIWLILSNIICKNICSSFFDYEKYFNETLTWRIISGIIFYLLLAFVFYFNHYYDNFKEQVLQEVELKALVREAELNALKFQINPHFLFNSLNSVSSLTITDPDKAQEMLIKLSEYLRYSLSKNQKQKTSFEEELKNMLLYLEIEKIRFGDKIIVKEEIENECMDMELPNLVLQPLIENAIKHGVYESTGKVQILIKALQTDDNLNITVENDYDPDAPARKGAGVGLNNILNRLELVYKRSDLIKIKKTKNIFTVNLTFPQKI